ncbi:MAG: hypothetical protein GY769_08165 [bacterium]|nr:hypothetical protein [bacterium]
MSKKRRRLIVAGNSTLAARWARENRVPSTDWEYVRDVIGLRGYLRKDVVVVKPVFLEGDSASDTARKKEIRDELVEMARREKGGDQGDLFRKPADGRHPVHEMDVVSIETYRKNKAKLGRKMALVYGELVAIGGEAGAEELSGFMGSRGHDGNKFRISPRLTDLKNLGLVRKTGRMQETPSEALENIWEIVPGKKPKS